MSYTLIDPNCPPDIKCFQCKRPLIPMGAKLVQVKVTGINDETGEVIESAGSTFATACKLGARPIYFGSIKTTEKPSLICKRCLPDWCMETGYFEHPLPNAEAREDLLCGLID